MTATSTTRKHNAARTPQVLDDRDAQDVTPDLEGEAPQDRIASLEAIIAILLEKNERIRQRLLESLR